MKKTTPPSEHAIKRAERIRYLREEVLNVSRGKFCQKHNISRYTLQNWEDLRYGGLTDKSVTRLVTAFRAEGIDCDSDWILYGKGEDPVLRSGLNTSPKSDADLLAQELQLFYELHQNAVDAIVADDGLAPCLMPGYRVAGKRLFNENISKAIGLPSIVQTQAGQLLIRLVQPSAIPEHYNLVCTNPQTLIDEPALEDIKLFYAAPIIWIRRPSID